ncbi:PREDICTED: ankyrin-1-like [Amphimedon queenslandica]|uniref:Uncharacterized protein n=1 Tax=Amphimedon queenslandica TaxID=400682 RepID=A0A1X7VH57_AMPQE|nr:PREDICTED: ankyrin-1-like [Amphimedon queenslandica]|eukprot:XP_011410232.1 PREDICTED: ankyrin-1-like [Amphimedon queenslandica]
MQRPKSSRTGPDLLTSQFAKSARAGYIPLAKRCLANGAHVDACIDVKYRDTALHRAVMNDHFPMTKLLLEAGANPNTSDKDMERPLHWAAQRGNIHIARLLHQFGAELNAMNKYGWTPLHKAALHGKTRMTKLLLEELNVDSNARDRWGDTALHKACHMGHPEVVQYLIMNGLIPTTCTNRRKNTADLEIPFNNPNRDIILHMFQNLGFVRMQSMHIDIEGDIFENQGNSYVQEIESEEQEESESEEDQVPREDFDFEEDPKTETRSKCCKCNVL